MTCRNYIGAGLCEAFPLDPGIPKVIITGRFDHTKPYPDDNGIGWQPEIPDDTEQQLQPQKDRNP